MSQEHDPQRRLEQLEAEVVALRAELASAEQDTDRTLLRATRLAQIVSALGQIDLSGRIGRVAGEVAELFLADVGLLLLGDDAALDVHGRWGVTQDDLGDGPHRVPDGLRDAGPVVAGPATAIELVPGLEPLAPRHVAWIRLQVHDRAIGWLCLARCAELPFSSSDVHELRAVGVRVSLAVENTRLQRRTSEQLEQLQVLHAMSAGLAGTIDPLEAGRITVRAVAMLAPETSVAVYRAAGDVWHELARHGEGELPVGLTGEAPTVSDPDVEILPLQDGDDLVGVIAARGLPAGGAVRAALPHVQHVAGLAFGKTVLHERTQHRARHDALTGLPNRLLLRERIDAALQLGRPLAVIFLDLDGFKDVNDSLGHDAGDRLLVEAARRLLAAVRLGDRVARFGGDEFVVICADLVSSFEAVAVADRIRAALREPFVIDGLELHVSVSQGIALGSDGATSETLLRDADTAMYRAKALGKDRAVVFDTDLREEVERRLDVALRPASGVR